MTPKAALRKKLLATKFADEIGKAEINNHILSYIKSTDAKTIAGFASIKNEPDIFPALTSLSQRCTIALPIIEGKNLKFRKWQPGRALTLNKHSIQEPSSSCEEILPRNIDIFLVPCVAVSHDFYRLGYGGGYYDRLMLGLSEKGQRASKKEVKVNEEAEYSLKHLTPIFLGITYNQFLLGELPLEPHDQKLDGIITEEGVVSKQS